MPRSTNLKKDDLIRKIRTTRRRLTTLVGKLDPEMTGSDEIWSVKEVLAHIAAWERLTLARLEAARAGTPPDIPPIQTEAGIDRFNAQVLSETRRRDYADVLQEFYDNHTALLAAVEMCEESFLQKALPPEWGRGRRVWELLAANTIWHYPEHIDMLEQWLKSTS